ncbi:MAG: hypothetical protein R8G66_23305 [Cytophagales bacterium]|nr:hypothetical protein [Cytophagales bacterium]
MNRSLLKIITPFCSVLMVLTTTSCVYNQHLLNNQPEHLSRPAIVLHATGAFKEDHAPLKRFETLKSDELITLKGGYVLLQHYSGRLFEYVGDTILVAGNAVAHSPNDNQSVPVELKFLFSDIPYKNTPTASTRIVPDYHYLYPFSSTFEINRDELICLWWERKDTSVSPEVEISIRDFDDNIVSSFRTDHRRIEIPIPENTSKNLFVIDLGHEDEYAGTIGFQVKDKQPGFTPCNASASIEYLQIATTLESKRHFKEAYEFYDRAAKASPQSIYEQFKLKALQRLF